LPIVLGGGEAGQIGSGLVKETLLCGCGGPQ
jgi:hypothetical protein